MGYRIMEVCEHMPNSVKAPYRRIAIVECPHNQKLRAIDERNCTIVWQRRKLHARGNNTAFKRAMNEAYDEIQRLMIGKL